MGFEGEFVYAVAVEFPVNVVRAGTILCGGGVFYQAERKRIWATATLPKIKKEERPDKDRSQVKMFPPPFLSKLINAKQPKSS